MTLRIVAAGDAAALAPLYSGGWNPAPAVVATVAQILADVRARGDAALVALARRFDDPDFSGERLRVPLPSLEIARSLIPPDVAAGFELARARVAAFHEKQRSPDLEYDDPDGSRYALLVRALGSVGAYVPAGSAPLPSSVIMSAVPAKIAGVGRVAIATPPARNRHGVDPAVLFACVLCGVDELYAAGGAQAIAAFAYGTATVARVDKIVGPGSVWVTEAKRQVFGSVGIDSLAGPSEVLVVADAAARPEFVAGEMLAQAEHDPLSRVAAVSTDRAILERVAHLLGGEFAREPGRGEIVASVLASCAFLIHARDDDEVLQVIERFAPEHLSLQTRDAVKLVPRIRHAGAIFVGVNTPVAAGDYVAGTNHVLPTSGSARFSSGLRLADFTRTISLVEYSEARMRADAPVLERLATFEGLPAHARTARMRA